MATLKLTVEGQLGIPAQTFSILIPDAATPPIGNPPSVTAGPNRTARPGEQITINGTASAPCKWSKIAGGGTITVLDPRAPTLAATFSAPGSYTLRLTATDGVLTAYDDVTITVADAVPPAVNKAPRVNAGVIRFTVVGLPITLTGAVSDDGLPAGAIITQAWSKESGPGDVTFGAATSKTTTATFSAVGVYVLRLTASDGLLSSSGDVSVTVSPVAPPPPSGGGTAFEIRNQSELDAALMASNPGDTLNLHGGDYAGGIQEMRGDPGNKFKKTMGGSPDGWWTLQSVPGEIATFRSDLKAYSIQYCRFLGIHFGEGGKIGIGTADWISGTKRSHHLEIKDCHFAGTQCRFGMIEIISDDLLIEDCTMDISTGGLTTDHGIYLHNGRRNTIRRCRIQGAAGYGIHVYDEKKHPGDAQNFYEDVTVEENVISGCRLRAGIIVSTGGDTKVLSVLIRKNVTYENNSGGICLTNYGQNNISGIKVLNNTCIDKIFWAADKDRIDTSEIRLNIALAGIFSGGGDVLIDDNFTGDPAFVDAVNHDYHLLPGSPASGYGAF